MDRRTLKCDYGLNSREVVFVEEYIKEVGSVDDLMLPFVVVNIRATLSVLDAAYNKTYTMADMIKGYSCIPNKTDKMLLDTMAFHGIKTL